MKLTAILLQKHLLLAHHTLCSTTETKQREARRKKKKKKNKQKKIETVLSFPLTAAKRYLSSIILHTDFQTKMEFRIVLQSPGNWEEQKKK